MNKILSTYNNNIDVFYVKSPTENQINHHIGWDNTFINTLKIINNRSEEIRLEIIPTAQGPYFAQENKTATPYPIEITSKKSNLIGYKQDSKTGSSTILNDAELTDLKTLLFEPDYTINNNSPLKKLLSEKIKDNTPSKIAHIVFSSKSCIVGIRVYMENSTPESMLTNLKKNIQT